MTERTFTFEVHRTSRAPASTLFRLATDGARWSEWAKPIVMTSSWDRQGDPAPGGIGAVRKVGMWPVLVREETVEYEPDRRHVYALISPGPAKDYRGELVLTPTADGGTELHWSGSLKPRIPGTGSAVCATMRGAVTFFATRLIRAAEREAGV